jgi:hypothetical protein
MQNNAKPGLILARALQILLILFSIYAAATKNVGLLFIFLMCILATVLPSIIAKKFNADLPPYFSLAILFVVYTEIIGNLLGLFTPEMAAWGYDKVLHVIDTFAITMLSIIIILTFHYYKKIRLVNWFVFVLALMTAMFIGSMYEIFEFISDKIFHMNAQLGLEDTMYDMIANFFGGLLAGIFVYVFI